ncbi:MAG: GNAT family N-acetyltransferase [Thermoplasmatales archaeon]|nr:GNAT family N-acetyltransferase [Thermoplasmatales archaeon]
MGSTEILDINQESIWRELVEKTPDRDIHFSPEYLSVLAKHMNASCHLFIYRFGDSYILYPFLKRKVNDLPFVSEDIGSTYWDISSSWYYGGPLFHGDIKNSDTSNFLSEFNSYCNDADVISEFCRFHPYLDNQKKLPDSIYMEKIATVVRVNLSRDIDAIFKSFKPSCRRHIKKSKKFDVTIKISNEDKSLREFYNLYTRSMQSKNARDFYFFSYDFLSNMKKNLCGNFSLFTLEYKDNILAGSIFLHKNRKMYYYLSARDPELDKVDAINRLLYEAIKFGNEQEIECLDLGGGPEGSSLLQFKKSFSDETKELYGYKKTYNREIYQRICGMSGLDTNKLKFEKASFFPEYRV